MEQLEGGLQLKNLQKGQFLMAEDIGQAAMYATYSMQNKLEERDLQMMRNILDSNWDDEEQMISNLLQYPFLIPEDIRIDYLIKGLEDIEVPYYILSAALGINRLKLEEKDMIKRISNSLKNAVFNEHGAVSMQAFICLQTYLKYPTDVDLFLDILKTTKSSLHHIAVSWLVLQINDKNELLSILRNANVPESLVLTVEKKMEKHCESLAHGEESPVSIEVFDYIPNLNDFEAMLDKEDTLLDFFEDLDTDNDNKLSANEVKTFLEDIGKEISIDEVIEEMELIGIDDSGNIDKDGFIEMMFPKFQVH